MEIKGAANEVKKLLPWQGNCVAKGKSQLFLPYSVPAPDLKQKRCLFLVERRHRVIWKSTYFGRPTCPFLQQSILARKKSMAGFAVP